MSFELSQLDDVLVTLRSQTRASGDNSVSEVSGVWSAGKHLFISTASGHRLCAFDLSSRSKPWLSEGVLLDESPSSVVSVLVHPSSPHCVLVVHLNSITAFWEYLLTEHRWVKQCQFQLSNAKGSQVLSIILQASSYSLFWCENRSATGPGLATCCVCRRQLASSWDGSLPEQVGQVDAILHSCPVVSLYTVKRELCIVPHLPQKQQLLLFWSFVQRTLKVYVYGHNTVEEDLDKTDFRAIYSELLCLLSNSNDTGYFVEFATHLSTQELATVDNHGIVSLVNSPDKQLVLTTLCCLDQGDLTCDPIDKIFLCGLVICCVGLSGKISLYHIQSGALLSILNDLKDKEPHIWFGIDELPTVGLFTSGGIWKLTSKAVVDVAAEIYSSLKGQKIKSSPILKKDSSSSKTDVNLFSSTELKQERHTGSDSDANADLSDNMSFTHNSLCSSLAGETNLFNGLQHAINYLSAWNIKHWSAKMALHSVISARVFSESPKKDCEIPQTVLNLLAGENFQNPALLLALLWDHSIHGDFARKNAQWFADETARTGIITDRKTALNRLLIPYVQEFCTLGTKYTATVNEYFSNHKENFAECLVPVAEEGKGILTHLDEERDVDVRRLNMLVDHSPEQLHKCAAEFLNFDSPESDSGGETLEFRWRKIFRLEWKDGQWRKQKLTLSSSHNSLLNILCHLFYLCQPDWLLRVVDKGLGTLHSVEGVAGHAVTERSYEDFITHSIIECLPSLTTEMTRSESVIVQAELLLFPGQEIQSLHLLLRHHLWPQAVDFVSSCERDGENYVLLFTILLQALLGGKAASMVLSQALELVPEGLSPHEVLSVLRDYAPSGKNPFSQGSKELKVGDVRGHLEMLLASK